jgi:hypothetical protein
MYEHRFKTSVSNGDHIYDERGNRSWNGMLFSSKKALLLNCITFIVVKSNPKIWAAFVIFKNLPEENGQRIGEI